jgi:hypothetical protein
MFASSGPGVDADTAENIRTAGIHAAILALLLLVSVAITFRGRGRAVSGILLALLALHPAWTISASMGDCGFLKVAASWIVTGIASLLMMSQIDLVLSTRRTPRPPPGPTSN